MTHMYIAIIVVMIIINSNKAVIVNGPYNNSKTWIEYSYPSFINGSLALYAINAKDCPSVYLPEYVSEAKIHNYMSVVTARDSTFAMVPIISFTYGSPVNFTRYPAFIVRNQRPWGEDANLCISIAETGSFDFSESPANTLWIARSEDPTFNVNVFNKYTRLVRGRTHLNNQWFCGRGTPQPPFNDVGDIFFKTTNNWNSGGNADGNLTNVNVFNLAIDDRETVQQAIAAVSNDPLLVSSYDPHISSIECQSLYFCNNANQANPNWTLVWTYPEDTYNVQLAMIKVPNREDDLHRLYVVALQNPTSPIIYCKWTDVSNSGQFQWHSDSISTSIPSGTTDSPTIPFDLMAESDNNNIHLWLATANGLYYALHNVANPGENIGWFSITGTSPNTLHSKTYYKITNDPHDRLNTVAIAGEVCSYYTVDRGLNWIPLYSSGKVFSLPVDGVVQKGSHLLSAHSQPGLGM